MASRRTRSVEPNPFWSERLRDEHRLRALRPAGLPERAPDHGLPPVPASEWERGEEAGGDTPSPLADGNLGGRLGDTERSGRREKSSAFGGWSIGFQTPPSSWQSEGVLPPWTSEVLKTEGTLFSAETELAEKRPKETNVREKGDVRESEETYGIKGIRDTMRVTEQPKMKVGFRDTAMGSMDPELDPDRGRVQKEEQGGTFLGRALGETMYKEVIIWRRRRSLMASSASNASSWVEVEKPPSTPKRSTSAVPNHTPGGARLPMGPPPELRDTASVDANAAIPGGRECPCW